MNDKADMLQCDNCDWTLKNGNVVEWHNKQCPKCKDCIIINDDDLKFFKGLQFMIKAGLATRDLDADLGEPAQIVELDTSVFRKNNQK